MNVLTDTVYLDINATTWVAEECHGSHGGMPIAGSWKFLEHAPSGRRVAPAAKCGAYIDPVFAWPVQHGTGH